MISGRARVDQWPAIVVCAALMLTVCVPLVAELKDPRLVLLAIPAVVVVVAACGFAGRWIGLAFALVIGVVSGIVSQSPMQRAAVVAVALLVPLVTWTATVIVMSRRPIPALAGPLVVFALFLLVASADLQTLVLLTVVVAALLAIELALLASSRGSRASTGRGWAITVGTVVVVASVGGLVTDVVHPYLGAGAHRGFAPIVPDDGDNVPQDIGSPLQWATVWQLGLGDQDSILMSLLQPVASVRPVWVSLEDYSKGTWHPPISYEADAKEVPSDPAGTPDAAVPAGMNIEVGLALPGPWIPAPQRVKKVFGSDALGGDIAVRANPATGTVASTTRPGGHTFYVGFAIPIASGAQLRNARPGLTDGSDVAVLLPGPLPPAMAALAASVEASAGPRVFDRLTRLAITLRSAPYEAATVEDLGPGNAVGRDLASLDRVLVDHRGFQEQYAAIWALIARSWGVPTQLSVGFLPRRAASSIVVHTNDASIWPSARLAGIGWVAFQPTPQDQAALRALFIRPWDPDRPVPTPPPSPTPTPAPSPSPDPVPDESGSFERNLAVVIGGALAIVVVLVVSWLVAVRLVRRRRRASQQRGDARQQVIGAWRWVRVLLREARMPLPESRPPGVLRADDLPDAEGRHVRELSALVVPALYASEPVTDADARAAWECALRLEVAVGLGSRRVRIRRWLRPVDRPWSRLR